MRFSDTYGWHIRMVTDSTGNRQPERMATVVEVDRRRWHVCRLWREGATRHQIARALDMATETVRKDLIASGIDPTGVKRYKGLRVDPDPIEWLDDGEPLRPVPVHAVGAPYQHSVTLGLWSAFIRECREQHHVNRLAHDAADAEEAGDAVWLANAAMVFQEAMTEAYRLQAVIMDRDARRHGQREEPPSPLRIVPN